MKKLALLKKAMTFCCSVFLYSSCQYEVTPWTGGYWHNINVQMNYWGAFNTNLEETFIPYLEYFKAYLPKASASRSKFGTVITYHRGTVLPS
jgi:hypothetical protein